MPLMNRICLYFHYLLTQIYYKVLFKKVGDRSVLYPPMKIVNTKYISIGNKTIIEKEATLYSVCQFGDKLYNGNISIGNNVYVNHHFNATCANKIIIEDDVLIAYNVSIFDFDHDYRDINKNCNTTDLIVKGPVVIGQGSWLGMNVAVLGRVRIGKHCIVGANSVVTKDVPDYCMVVGNPAKIIKRFDQEKNTWIKVEEKRND